MVYKLWAMVGIVSCILLDVVVGLESGILASLRSLAIEGLFISAIVCFFTFIKHLDDSRR